MKEEKPNKDKLQEIKDEILQKRREKTVADFKEELTHVAYDIYRVGKRSFKFVVFNYNPETDKVIIVEKVDFNNPVIGMSFEKEKENMKAYKKNYGSKDDKE